jgi:hypothetical protein
MKISEGLAPFLAGGGRAERTREASWRLTLPPTPRGYADAQIDDYQSLPRAAFPWRPPLRLSLRARVCPPTPLGTFGFGFWNDPFTLSLGQGGAARRLPASPQAVWFFYGSPPNALAFAPGAPADGWKAMSLRGPTLPVPALAPGAAAAFLLSRVPALRGPVVRLAKRTVRAAEAALSAALDGWHAYALDWHPCEARFEVDGQIALVTDVFPRPPLGFVAWIDNQFATASPETGLRFGTLPTSDSQTLEIADLRIERL